MKVTYIIHIDDKHLLVFRKHHIKITHHHIKHDELPTTHATQVIATPVDLERKKLDDDLDRFMQGL